MGVRIDLRTLIYGLLHQPQIRTVMMPAQKSRTLYYHLRVCGIFLDAYKSIRQTFINCYLRDFEKRIKAKRSKGFWSGYSDTRNPYYLNNMFGKIIQNYFKSSIARVFKRMRLENDNLFGEEDPFDEINSRTANRVVKSAIRQPPRVPTPPPRTPSPILRLMSSTSKLMLDVDENTVW